MGRKKPRRAQSGAPAKKKHGGGLLMGMRGGFQKAVKGTTGVGAKDAAGAAKKASLLSNVITVLLFIAAGVMLLRRCGYVKF